MNKLIWLPIFFILLDPFILTMGILLKKGRSKGESPIVGHPTTEQDIRLGSRASSVLSALNGILGKISKNRSIQCVALSLIV